MRLYNYWWLLIWAFIIGFLSLYLYMQREEVVDGRVCVRWTPMAAFILTVPYVIWAGWREWFADTEQYRTTFLALPSSPDQIIPYMQGVQKGPAFRLFELVFKCFISRSDIAFFLCVAAIQMACIVYIYRKYSPDFWLSFFLFIASTDYLSWMHNGIRQFIAVVMLFLCVPLIAKKRYIAAIIIILLAALFHSTALIFLPFVFIVNGKAWNLRTIIFILSVIVAILFVDRITGFLTEVMVDTAYESDISILINDDGTNMLRVLFYSVPAMMSYVLKPHLEKLNDPLLNVCSNLSIVTAGFFVFSYFTSGILMGSIPIYFSLTNYILIPIFFREFFERNTAKVLEVVFLIVYTAFFYYQCGPTWGLL